MFGRRYRPEMSLTELVNAYTEADRALRQRDAAVRHALGKQILADIDAIAMPPTWNPEQRATSSATRHAIKSMVAMRSGLPPEAATSTAVRP